MTQLPQTYGHYLPSNGGHQPATESVGSQLADLGRMLSIVWRRKFRIAFCTLLGIGAGYAYLKYAPPVYKSAAEVLVVPRKPYNLSDDFSRNAYLLDDLSMHDAMIQGPKFAGQAIEKGNLAALPSLADKDDVADEVADGLSVERVTAETRNSPNSVINISYRGADPDDCRQVLEAVTAAYCEFIQVKGRGDDAFASVTTQAEEVLAQLQQKEAAYAAFRQTAPAAFANSGSGAMQRERVAEIERRRSEVVIKKAEAERRLASLRQAIERGVGEGDLASLALGARDQEIRSESLQKHLLPLLLEEKTLLEQFGVGHPDVIAVRQRIKLARDFIASSDEQGQQLLAQLGTGGKQTPNDMAKAYARALEQELSQLVDSEQALSELVGREQASLQSVTAFETQALALQGDIDRSRQLHDSLMGRVREASISRDMLGYDTTVIAPAGKGKQVAPVPKLALPVGAFLGMQFGLALAFLAEASDKRFRNPQEIRGRLGIPVIGHIPLHAPASRELRKKAQSGEAYDPALCTYYRPNSPEAEAYRGVRAALLFNQHGNRPKLVQVTSPTDGDGKSTVAANLAISLANSGKNVLLLDANLRDPRLHEMFCLRGEDGLARLLDGGVEMRDAIFPTSIKGLSVLPAGLLPLNAQDLISSREFFDLLHLLREKFDMVLLDTPALLSVTDPLVVAKLVDGVVLTIRVTKADRSQAGRATDLLMSLGANVLGVVVNARDDSTNYATFAESAYLLESPSELVHG